MNDTYVPIDCDFYDELTLRALRQIRCEVVYRTAEGLEKRAERRIEDVFTRGNEEFIRLSGGAEVRLDRLVAVDGIRSPSHCPV